MTTHEILRKAKESVNIMSNLTTQKKNAVLISMADSLCNNTDSILKANNKDIKNASSHMNAVMLDRLRLDENRILDMAKGIREVATLTDPVGKILETTKKQEDLIIKKVSVPIGVIAIIYEARPNVTSDAAALSLKSGNVCVLRPGKEAFASSHEIIKAMRKGLTNNGLPEELINIIEDTSRDSANELMNAVGYIDLLIPRGGAGLINACINNAKVPCIQTGTGICHIYVDEYADFNKALDIIENAKTSRPSVCNAAEVLLVNEKIAKEFLPLLKKRLTSDRINRKLTPVELRLDKFSASIIQGSKVSEKDFDTEFLDFILAIKTVNNENEAIKHILRHSTGHSECIITENKRNAELFCKLVDSAAVYVNASTRFTDGGEFGLGCEIGISTQKLHARGPMGLKELTTYKYIIKGNGNIR